MAQKKRGEIELSNLSPMSNDYSIKLKLHIPRLGNRKRWIYGI
jgi:hypothetical protein